MLGRGGLAARPDPPAGGSGSINFVQAATPRNQVKRRNGPFYWFTRACFPSFGPLMPAGPDFRYTNFSGGRGFPHFTYTHFSGCRHRRSLATQTFRVAVTVAFYLHKLFRVAVTVAVAF